MDEFKDVDPFSADDEQLFADVREVLIRHGALDRFGLTLLHRHFEMSEDEVLVESVDADARTLIIRPERLDAGQGESPTATSWRFTADDVRPVERLTCWPAKDRHGNIVGHMQ